MGLSRIFFDTNLLIYLMEGEGEFAARTSLLVSRMKERRDELVTSTLTIGEILVKPMTIGDEAFIKRYMNLLDTPGIVVVPFDRAVAPLFARIRVDRTIKPPDAIQLACAAHAKCDLFVTNDDRLSKKNIPGVQFILSLEKTFI